MKTQIQYFVSIYILFFTFNSFAGTPLANIISAHNQDALVLGTVTKKMNNDTFLVRVIYVFPQTKKSLLNIDGNIIIQTGLTGELPSTISKKRLAVAHKNHKDRKKVILASNTLAKGKKYLLSLNKETRWLAESIYRPAWGFFEVKGNNHSNMELVQKNHFEHDELQSFINSGGIK